MSFLSKQTENNTPVYPSYVSVSVLIKMWVLPQLWLWDLLSADSFITENNKIFHLKYEEKT